LDDLLVKNVDVLDAVVCLLAGADFLLDRAKGPRDEEELQMARKGVDLVQGKGLSFAALTPP